MKKNSIRFTALCLVLIMGISLLCSCADVKTTKAAEADTDTDTDTDTDGELYSTVVLNIAGFDITYETYRYLFLSCKKNYESNEDYDKDGELEFIKNDVLNELKYETAIRKLAKEYGVSVSEDDYSQIDSMMAYYDSVYQSYYGITFAEYCAHYYMTENFYREFYALNNFLVSGVYEYFADESNNLLPEPTEEDLVNSAEGYVRVKHILVKDGEEEEAETKFDGKSAEQVANEIRAELLACTDAASRQAKFAELEKQYNEDQGMDDEEGYYFTEGEFVEEFEKASFSLEVNEVSELVESDYGYHVIMRFEMEEDYIKTQFYPYYAFNIYVRNEAQTLTHVENDFYKNITLDSIK